MSTGALFLGKVQILFPNNGAALAKPPVFHIDFMNLSRVVAYVRKECLVEYRYLEVKRNRLRKRSSARRQIIQIGLLGVRNSRAMELIDKEQLIRLGTLASESKSVIVLSTSFNPKEKLDSIAPANYQLTPDSISLIEECVSALRFGGLFFVYGLPHQLALWGERLSHYHDSKTQMLFKYWISLDIDEVPRKDTLEPTSVGLLMYLKSKSNSNTPTPFHLNTSTVRTPHAYCSA